MKIKPVSNVSCVSKYKEKNDKNITPVVVASATAGVVLTGAILYNIYSLRGGRLRSVSEINKEKFLNLCKGAKPEFYNASQSNIENKVFKLDLHSHSNHSDGRGKVSDIMTQVADYADALFAKTGEKFTFSLTDHDRISGVKEALELIKLNPDKYKNINFIPGVELSFAFVSGGNVYAGEMLAYNINPESKAINNLIDNVSKNRLKMIDDCINQLGNGFKRSEMNGYFLNNDGESFSYFLHYRLRNYAQIKNRIAKIAEEKGENVVQMYKKLMDGFIFSGEKRRPKPLTEPKAFDRYLKEIDLQTNSPVIDSKIDEICERFYPKIVDGKVSTNCENSFEKIIDSLKDEKDVVLGFAHPYFTLSRMGDFKKETEAMLKYANGKILLSENYHQAYPPQVPREKIEEVNQFLLEKNLIPIGGRDNHQPSFL